MRVAQVCAALAAPRAPAAHARAEQVAEQVVEQIAERGEVAAGEAAGPARAHALEAEAVVGAALLGVGEHRVGLGRLLELLFGARVVGIAIGMEPQRELAVRLLQLFVRRAARDAEHVVVVALGQSFVGCS